ncbi:TPA: helix-turn-helix domain-containing protein [Enterococcus faecalis]
MIGETFRYLRKGKSLTLKEVCEDTITVAFLSRFERGLTDISTNNLLKLLKKINITFQEFCRIHEARGFNELEFFSEIQHNYQEGNFEWLKKQMKYNEYSNRLMYLLLKSMLSNLKISNLTKSEQKEIIEYLSKINNWTYFDLYLYGHVMYFLPLESILLLSNEAKKRAKIYHKYLRQTFSIYFLIFNNTILFLLRGNMINEAEKFFMLLSQQLLHPRDFYHKIKINGLKALILYKKDSKSEAIRLLKQNILAMSLVNETSSLVKEEKRYLESWLTNEEIKEVFSINSSVIDQLFI